ncbi:MAG: WYL domain-containing protein [Acutalibacteraceae bacterium]
MSFSTNKGLNEQIKVRLNLSPLAYSVVQFDMNVFENEKYSNFLNRVFLNFANSADASIFNTLNRYKSNLEHDLGIIKMIDESARMRIISKLVSNKETELESKANYEKGGANVSIDLNQSVKDYLFKECSEEKYYNDRCSKYIKCVIEEYARLPYVEREKIYFKAFVEEIEKAIKENCTLKVSSGNNIFYEVYPYKFMTDVAIKANYLVGYRKKLNSKDSKEICVYRLSRLKHAEARQGHKLFVSEEDIGNLEKSIKTRGVEFLIGNEQYIKVKMTPNGVYQYNRALNLRPAYIEKSDDNIFTFNCTRRQAEFYFFKFGKDAEIIEPLDLRNKFKEEYEKAAEIYREN